MLARHQRTSHWNKDVRWWYVCQSVTNGGVGYASLQCDGYRRPRSQALTRARACVSSVDNFVFSEPTQGCGDTRQCQGSCIRQCGSASRNGCESGLVFAIISLYMAWVNIYPGLSTCAFAVSAVVFPVQAVKRYIKYALTHSDVFFSGAVSHDCCPCCMHPVSPSSSEPSAFLCPECGSYWKVASPNAVADARCDTCTR